MEDNRDWGTFKAMTLLQSSLVILRFLFGAGVALGILFLFMLAGRCDSEAIFRDVEVWSIGTYLLYEVIDFAVIGVFYAGIKFNSWLIERIDYWIDEFIFKGPY